MLEYATKKLYDELDKKSEELKNSILNTKTEVTFTGTAHYVSNDGNDDADGLTPETAWKTNAKVSAAELNPGDAVFFRRGDLFRGRVFAKPGVTYSAYGEGPKPKIYAYRENAAKPEKWELFDKERMIWRYTDEILDAGTLVFNDGEAVGLKEIPSFIDGEFRCLEDKTKKYDFREHLTRDFMFFQDNCKVLNDAGLPNVGDPNCTGNLYLRYSGGNPGEVFDSIELNTKYNLIQITGNGITIDNLCIKHAGSHGIGSGTVDDLTVQNCEIGWIGGSIQFYSRTDGHVVRFGNGVEIYGGCHRYTVKNCWVYECYDAGVTHQVSAEDKHLDMFDVTYEHNLIENCVYSIEYFLSRLTPENTCTMKNFFIRDNIMRFCGFGWGRQRIGHANAHIKGWDSDNPNENYIIENNIFDRSTDKLIHVASKRGGNPILRNNTYIQYPNAKFGRIGVPPTELVYFDIEKGDKIVEEKFGEQNGKFYIAY